MTPTSHLRFVERDTGTFEQYDVKVTERHGTEVCYQPKKIRVLQQWWALDKDDEDAFIMRVNGDWRDIPLEKEE